MTERRIEHDAYTLIIQDKSKAGRTVKIVKAVPKNNVRWSLDTARKFFDMFLRQGYRQESAVIFGESPTNKNSKIKDKGEMTIKDLDEEEYYQDFNDDMRAKLNSFGNFVFYLSK